MTGRPVPAAVLRADREAARRRFGIAADERCLLVMGGSQGARSINRCAIEAFAERPGRDFHVVHVAGRRDFEELEERLVAAPHGRALHPARLRARPRRLPRGLRPRPRPLRRLDLRADGSGPAGDPRSLPARHRRPPERQRRLDGAGRGGGRHSRRGAERQHASTRRSRDCSATRRGWRRWRRPRRALAKPDAARRIADEVLGAVEGMSGSGQARLGRPPPPLHRHRRRRDERPGAGLRGSWARPSPAATAPTPLIWSACARPGLEPAVGHDARQRALRTPRWSSRPRSPRTTRSWRLLASARHRGDAPRRAAGRALRGEAPDRGRRHPWQDDDDRDGGLGAAGDRRRPRLLRRRRGARPRPRRRRRQRRLGGGGVGRRRGRRERRQLPRAEPRGRGDHQRRDGPPLALGLAGRAARGLRRSSPRKGRAGRRAFDARLARTARSSSWRSPAATTCSTPRAALAAIELAGLRRRCRRSGAAPTSAGFAGGSS